jgi:TP901-1 family phage major tail protein
MALDLIDGKAVLIEFGTDTFVGQRTASFELSTDEIDTTTKDSNLWKESFGGERSGTMTVEGITPLNGDPASTFAKIFDAWKNGIVATVKYYSEGNGVSAFGFISQITFSANKNEAQGYSITFQLTGDGTYA